MRRRPSKISCMAFESWSEGLVLAQRRETARWYLNVAKEDAPPRVGSLIRGDAQGVCKDRLWTPDLTVAARRYIMHQVLAPRQ